MRYMIRDNHWPTDGEWKESVLRSLIRRHAPSTVSVGRGFVVSESGSSSQIDILIHDNAHPVLYRDGDLVFVAPAACRAAIEVKSRLTATSFRQALDKLADNAEFIRRGRGGHQAFIGLFAYEENRVQFDSALGSLANAARGSQRRTVDHVALGDSHFIKWWSITPSSPRRTHNAWHVYELPEMAAGYFLHNLLLHLSPDAHLYGETVWFPEESKETRRIAQRFRDA